MKSRLSVCLFALSFALVAPSHSQTNDPAGTNAIPPERMRQVYDKVKTND